ncbi:tyrosine-type recombinase/integrase [Pyruvatibacter mobilis]|uniref:tyrosine-type recombinase/integrase n=1 Tax=Pyruvatibacter mobilis TaxID=1712261 RepID=UPI003BAAEA79
MADLRRKKTAKGTIVHQVRYRSPSTKSGYAYRNFETVKQAKEFLSHVRQKSSNGLSQSTIRTVDDAVGAWLDICQSEGLNGGEPVTRYTLQNYSYRSGFVLGFEWPKEIWQLTAPDIVSFRSWLLRNAPSRETAQKVMITLHSVMKEMAIRGVIATNIATGITIRMDSRYDEPITIPTTAEIKALLWAADSLANSSNGQTARAWQRYRPMLYLAIDSGMRPQEYLALPRHAITEAGINVVQALDGGERRISVPKTKAGRRHINISESTMDMVSHYASRHAPENPFDLVFPTEKGTWQTRRNWQRRGFNIACLEAGLVSKTVEGGKTLIRPKFRPYDLRHFFASMLIAQKLDLKRIQSMMGHESIKTTLDTYGHLIGDEEASAPRPGLVAMLGDKVDVASCGSEATSL